MLMASCDARIAIAIMLAIPGSSRPMIPSTALGLAGGRLRAPCLTKRRRAMTMDNFTHKRRCQLTVNIGADTWKDVAHELNELARRCHEAPIVSMCSGGYRSNHVAAGSEDKGMTGDKYRALLKEWGDKEGNR